MNMGDTKIFLGSVNIESQKNGNRNVYKRFVQFWQKKGKYCQKCIFYFLGGIVSDPLDQKTR
jgi:hypothetical protein